MTGRLRASVIPGLLALTALALTACTSQGTIQGADGGPLPPPAGTSGPSTTGPTTPSATGSTAPSSGGTDSSTGPAPATSSSAAPSSQDPSVLASSLKTLNQLWKDPGCKTALSGMSDYLYAQQAGQAQAVAAIPGAVKKIRAGAQQTKQPGAAPAMNKLAADLQAMATEAKQGQTPNKGPVKNDWQVMGTTCSQPTD